MSKVFENKFKIKFDWFVNSWEVINNKAQSSSAISARLRKLEGYYVLLTEAYESILNVCTADDVTLIKEYELKYKEATEIYNNLEAFTASYPPMDGTCAGTETTPMARLPRIDLVTFDGDLFSWSSFSSLFNSTLIRHLPMLDVSLDTALDILKARFENKRLLADSHISRILQLPTLVRVAELRVKLLNPLLESTRALNNLGLPTNEWSYILLYIGLSKLPTEIKTRFEQKYGGDNNNLPTFDQLIEFLQNECRFIDTAAATVREPLSYAVRTRRSFDTKNILLTENHNGYRTERVNHKLCCYCQASSHEIKKCFKFDNLTKQDRKGWVQANGLCFKCFGSHSASSCRFFVPCGRCGNTGHNELICTFIARSNDQDDKQRTRHAFAAACDNVARNRRSQYESRRHSGSYSNYKQRDSPAREVQHTSHYNRRNDNDGDEQNCSNTFLRERHNQALSPTMIRRQSSV